ncbi:MAG: SpoIIE family protein phosphatase [Bacteroidales bacterium]|nr:SpoIIE family protein phosphatase [Bacteroidales bacterium]
MGEEKKNNIEIKTWEVLLPLGLAVILAAVLVFLNLNGNNVHVPKTSYLCALLFNILLGVIGVVLLWRQNQKKSDSLNKQLAQAKADNEKLLSQIHDNEVFVDIATSVNMPKFIISGDRRLYWTNIESKDYDIDKTPEEIVEMLINSPAAAAAIEKCRKRDLIGTYEVETGSGDEKISLNITLSKIKYKNDSEAIYGNITNISEHQRELSMQAEMLSLITAQMEVQQAGIKEQNEVLSEQHKRLEEQAQKLTEAFQELALRNKQITTKTNYITDSIKYAQTIQEAMLPGEEQMRTFFDNFIVYRPKDIVSGDFYWMTTTPEYTFAVLGDCTGHGVPGAFMSMIGIRILGELINENKIYCPSVILENMHGKIQAALKQDVSENNDGMDIAICRFKRVQGQPHQWELQYAGAKQPIFIYRRNADEVETVEADRRGIGGQTYAEVFLFTDHDVCLNNGDRVYLTTDGIKDQNNIMRKRFGTARVKLMLKATFTEHIEDQKMFVDALLNNWQGLEEQRDDISLWGFELNDKTT